MKEEEAGLISALLGRKSTKAKDIKRRFYECELRVKKLKNKINILQKQYENELELQVNLRVSIQEHCEYLKREVGIIMDELQAISIDYPDTVTNAKIRDLLKKTRKEIGRSKEVVDSVIKRASTPFFFADNEVDHPDKHTTKSQQAWQKEKPSRKRSTSPHCMKNAFNADASDAEIISKRVETNKDEIKKFVEASHSIALEMHKALNDKVGDGQESEMNRNIVSGGRVERRSKKISTSCYIIVIIIIVLVVAGSGAAIYMLFY